MSCVAESVDRKAQPCSFYHEAGACYATPSNVLRGHARQVVCQLSRCHHLIVSSRCWLAHVDRDCQRTSSRLSAALEQLSRLYIQKAQIVGHRSPDNGQNVSQAELLLVAERIASQTETAERLQRELLALQESSARLSAEFEDRPIIRDSSSAMDLDDSASSSFTTSTRQDSSANALSTAQSYLSTLSGNSLLINTGNSVISSSSSYPPSSGVSICRSASGPSRASRPAQSNTGYCVS